MYNRGDCGGISVGRESAFQAECREFESRPPLQLQSAGIEPHSAFCYIATPAVPELWMLARLTAWIPTGRARPVACSISRTVNCICRFRG